MIIVMIGRKKRLSRSLNIGRSTEENEWNDDQIWTADKRRKKSDARESWVPKAAADCDSVKIINGRVTCDEILINGGKRASEKPRRSITCRHLFGQRMRYENAVHRRFGFSAKTFCGKQKKFKSPSNLRYVHSRLDFSRLTTSLAWKTSWLLLLVEQCLVFGVYKL
jgi:hypothetical protein